MLDWDRDYPEQATKGERGGHQQRRSRNWHNSYFASWSLGWIGAGSPPLISQVRLRYVLRQEGTESCLEIPRHSAFVDRTCADSEPQEEK